MAACCNFWFTLSVCANEYIEPEDSFELTVSTDALNVSTSSLAEIPVIQKKYLVITYPEPKDVKGVLSLAQIRYAGYTIPGATVTLNNVPVKTFPNGVFVGLVQLKHGKNELGFKAVTSSGVAEYSLNIVRAQKRGATRTIPVSIENELILPNAEQTLIPGDILEVRFKGSPGGTAGFAIEGIEGRVKMAELSGWGKDKTPGVYVGHYVVQPKDKVQDAAVRFYLSTKNGSANAKSKSKVSFMPGYILTVGKIKYSGAMFYADPQASRKLFYPQPGDTVVAINGKYGNYFRVRLSNTETAWVRVRDVELLPQGMPPEKTNVWGIKVSTGYGEYTKIYFSLDARVPVKLDQVMYPSTQLVLTLYGANVDTGWTADFLENKYVKNIKTNYRADDVVEFVFDLDSQQHWGAGMYYEDTYLVLQIEHPPKVKLAGERALEGLTVFVDAGHGGRNFGAIGSGGLVEKEVNLAMSEALGVYLEKAGAKVVYSRYDNDTELSWTERANLAKKAGADIFVCMHNNSVPENYDPLKSQGAAMFYGYPGDKELAKNVFAELVKIGLKPAYYVYWNPFITQASNMVWVLVEAAFLSYPDDEALLAEQGFRKKIGHAVFMGISNFVKNEAGKK
ncbi:MAG: N-acetylmuramoyl-L-alanine amidase [Elusimicrobiota bacterium]